MKYRTIGLIVALALSLFMVPLCSDAQQPAKVPRIAFLGLSPPPSSAASFPFADAFRQGLRELGWVEGRSIAIEWRWAEGSLERFASLVADLVRLKVDVLVVPNATTARVAMEATTTIPIVVVAGGTLLETGLVASLARPGGNITGVGNLGPELMTKRLELLKEAAPGATRVAMLRGLSPFTLELRSLEGAARSLGVGLHLFEVREPAQFDSPFAAMTKEQVHAVLMLGDPSMFPHRAQIADLAAQRQLPVMCVNRLWVETGCLMSYGESQLGQGQLVASYVDKILKGATPADLPVEQPTTFELVINLKTAHALGLTFPPSILMPATEVIQ